MIDCSKIRRVLRRAANLVIYLVGLALVALLAYAFRGEDLGE